MEKNRTKRSVDPCVQPYSLYPFAFATFCLLCLLNGIVEPGLLPGFRVMTPSGSLGSSEIKIIFCFQIWLHFTITFDQDGVCTRPSTSGYFLSDFDSLKSTVLSSK